MTRYPRESSAPSKNSAFWALVIPLVRTCFTACLVMGETDA